MVVFPSPEAVISGASEGAKEVDLNPINGVHQIANIQYMHVNIFSFCNFYVS